MKPRHAVPILFAATVCLWTALAVPSAAKTVVSPKGRNITITVPIDAVGIDRKTAHEWKDSMESVWNAAFNSNENPFKGCFNLKLVVDIDHHDWNYPAQPGRHMIFGSHGASRNQAQGTIAYNGNPYRSSADGNFDEVFGDGSHSRHLAHEVGHLLGLPDEYKVVSTSPRRTEPLEGRRNTLMADGGRIDQALLTRLVNRLRNDSHNIPDGVWSEVFLYDVTVKGEKSGSETVQGMEGEFSFSYAYTARYLRVPVTVEHNCGSGDIKLDGPTDRAPHAGSATLDFYQYRDSLTRKIKVPTGRGTPFSLKDDAPYVYENLIEPCGFDVSMGSLRAEIALTGYVPGSPGELALFGMDSRLPNGEDRLNNLIAARHREQCNKSKHHHSNVSAGDGLSNASARREGHVQFYSEPTEVAGVGLYPPSLNLRGNIGALGDSADARKLVRGEPFSVSSGRRTYEGADARGSVKAATSVTVTFSRAR